MVRAGSDKGCSVSYSSCPGYRRPSSEDPALAALALSPVPRRARDG
jgi:hypothetical protein